MKMEQLRPDGQRSGLAIFPALSGSGLDLCQELNKLPA